jgi:hypothetical protein
MNNAADRAVTVPPRYRGTVADAAPVAAYLIASGLVGEPTAPVIGIAGATNMNS